MPTLVKYALTSESRVKDRLAITNSDLDTVIKRMIYGATDFIQRACDTVFKQTTYTDEKYNGSESMYTEKSDYILILRKGNVSSVTAIKYNNGTQGTPSWVTMSADDYVVDYETGIIHFYAPLPSGIQNIAVTYVSGYLIDFSNEFDSSLHTLPYDVSDLCERLVVKLLKRRESEGRSNETFNGSTITWGDFLEDHDKSIIANYRRAFVA